MRIFNAVTGLIAGLGAGTANAGGPVIIEEEGAPEQAVAPSQAGVKPVFIILGVAAALLLLANSDSDGPPCTGGEC
jgi:hypothetical protein